jgi:hypothetical protein
MYSIDAINASGTFYLELIGGKHACCFEKIVHDLLTAENSQHILTLSNYYKLSIDGLLRPNYICWYDEEGDRLFNFCYTDLLCN